uniref:Uncharacterized protein n=1 Tax=Emiliania huxleyi TaxID=2903 RepID=A0A7S3T6L2_EMIHU
MATSVSCACGNARLRFHSPAPAFTGECCCEDCRQACEWAETMGCKAKVSHSDPTLLAYYQNDVCVEAGRERLRAFRLREGGESVRIVATCCYSPMCTDHPAYLKRVVLTFPQLSVVGPPPATPPDMLMVKQEWPTSFTPLASTGRDPFKGRAFNTHSDALFLATFVFRVLSRGRTGGVGSTVQGLVESLGGVHTLGLPKGQGLVGPTKGQTLTPPPPAGAGLTPIRVAGVAVLALGVILRARALKTR